MCCQIEHSAGTLNISSKPLYVSKEANSLVERKKACSFWWSTLTGFHDLCTHHLMLNPEISPPFSNLLLLASGEMQWGLKFCWELQNCLTASSYWGCRGRTTGGARELLQRRPVLSFHKPPWQLTRTTTSAFKERLFCFHSPVTHTTLPVSSFLCPLIRCLLTVHHSHHRKRSQS